MISASPFASWTIHMVPMNLADRAANTHPRYLICSLHLLSISLQIYKYKHPPDYGSWWFRGSEIKSSSTALARGNAATAICGLAYKHIARDGDHYHIRGQDSGCRMRMFGYGQTSVFLVYER